MKVSVLVLAALWPMASIANELYSERLWKSQDGKALRGTCIRTINGGSQIEVLTSTGKIVVIGIANLSEADRKLVAAGGKPEGGSSAEAGKPGDAAVFKTLPEPDRSKLPIISQGDFGNKASDCVPSSFCNFLLWWDEAGILEIPKRGDFNDKAEWIHSRIARYCVTRNNAGTNVEKANEGFAKYFETHLGELATSKFRIDYDVRPENLSRYTVGVNATMLSVTIRQPARHDSGHWVALRSASPDGEIVFHTWGARFEGKIGVLEKKAGEVRLGTQRVSATTYEIKIQNEQDLPEWFHNSDRKFVLDPANWDSIYVLKPYLYAEKGKRAKAPADPLLDGPPPVR